MKDICKRLGVESYLLSFDLGSLVIDIKEYLRIFNPDNTLKIKSDQNEVTDILAMALSKFRDQGKDSTSSFAPDVAIWYNIEETPCEKKMVI